MDLSIYACQKYAWMDEAIMFQWVDQVFTPHTLEAHTHVVPLLLLDSYRCHMMAFVVMWINELVVKVQHIPGGCTSLCQAMDV